MSTLEKAIEIACGAHLGQVDKAGELYVLHPLRLMFMFQDDVERIVAVLHDVVEDSEISLDDLKFYGFSEIIIDAVNCLTKKVNESYDDFIVRISSNSLAKKIKIEDIKDNLDLTRMASINEQDLARVKKYHKSLNFLLQ